MYKWLTKENLVSVPTALLRVVRNVPDRIALDYVLAVKFIKIWKFRIPIIIGTHMPYRKLWELSMDFTHLFRKILLEKNNTETIAIFSLNCPQVFGAYFGAHLAQAIPVFISPATIIKELRSNKPLENIQITNEIWEQILVVRPKIILVLDILWPILRQMEDDLGDTRIIMTRLSDMLPIFWRLAYKKDAVKKGRWVVVPSTEKVSMLNDLLTVRNSKIIEDYPGAREITDTNLSTTIAHLIFTGGTTGMPKAPMITHENIISNVLQCRKHLDEHITGGERVFGFMPVFHSYGLIVALLTLLNMEGTLSFSPSFDLKESAYLLRKRRIQICAGINRMYKSFMTLKNREKEVLRNLPNLKFCISGAGALDPKVQQEFEDVTGSHILDGYGATQTSPVVSLSLPSDHKVGSMGRLLPGISKKIVDVTTGKVLPPGNAGKLFVSGPNIMFGFYNDPDETEKVLTDGWFDTEDTVVEDEDGFLYFVGRVKEMSKINGENVYWPEVEKHFLTSDIVQKCAVFGVPREGYLDEELLVVFVVLKIQNLGAISSLKTEANRKGWLIKETVAVSEKTFLEFEDVVGKVPKRKIREYYEKK